jgi:hypothetical protein
MRKLLASTLVALMILCGASLGASQSFEEEFNREFTPPEVTTSYHYKEDAEWTVWNKALFASAIGGHAADIWTTREGLDGTCTESNPILGDDPSVGILVLAKVGVMGLSYWLTEYYFDDLSVEDQQVARNWVYGFNAAIGSIVALRNNNLDCN